MASLLLARAERLTGRVYNIHGITATAGEIAEAVARPLVSTGTAGW